MISAKDIMESMVEGEEYVNAMMPKQIFNQINHELQEEMYFTIRQKSSKYKDDQVHCTLLSTYMKAKSNLAKYEFDLNNK